MQGMISRALHRVDRGVESGFDMEVLSKTAWRKSTDGAPQG
jgi:hypothetical protein